MVYYGCAIYGARNPLFGLLFFIHIVIFRPENLVWGNPEFGHLHLITALLIFAGGAILNPRLLMQRGGVYQKRTLFIFGLFAVWLMIVSGLAEVSTQLSFTQAWEVLKVFVICLIFSKLINTEQHINLYVWVTVISFGLLSAWGIEQSFLGNDRLDTLWVADSNAIAAQFALMAPLALAKAFDPNLSRKYKLLFLACAVSMAFCTVATQSRSGLLALCIGMFFLIMMTKHRVKLFATVAVIAVLVVPWITSKQNERISSIFVSAEERDVAASSRLVLWRLALYIWEDYPIAGIGLNNFPLVKNRYAGQMRDYVQDDAMYYNIFEYDRVPHGSYTGLLAESGVVGFALLIALLLTAIASRVPRQLVDSDSHGGLYLLAKGAQAGLVAFAFAAAFSDIQWVEMLYFHIFFLGAIKSYAATLVHVPDEGRQAALAASRAGLSPMLPGSV
jgi:O-antigen ligase